MSRKNSIIITIVSVVLGIALISGITYAYIAAETEGKGVSGNTGKVDITYDITESITGPLIPSSSRDGGLTAIATAKLNTGSVPAKFNLYITPSVITGLNIAAFKWEVEGMYNDEVVYTNNGNFADSKVSTAIKIVDGYTLQSSITTFNIYIWLDGNLVTDSALNKRFAATLSADSVPITGEF